MPNFFDQLPKDLSSEHMLDILRAPGLRIERIVSRGHSSPDKGWYDQEENEWVMVLQGRARILFENDRVVALEAGDYVHIPAHSLHKVEWTDPDQLTIWLAVFYQ